MGRSSFGILSWSRGWWLHRLKYWMEQLLLSNVRTQHQELRIDHTYSWLNRSDHNCKQLNRRRFDELWGQAYCFSERLRDWVRLDLNLRSWRCWGTDCCWMHWWWSSHCDCCWGQWLESWHFRILIRIPLDDDFSIGLCTSWSWTLINKGGLFETVFNLGWNCWTLIWWRGGH